MADAKIPMEIGLKRTFWEHFGLGIEQATLRLEHINAQAHITLAGT